MGGKFAKINTNSRKKPHVRQRPHDRISHACNPSSLRQESLSVLIYPRNRHTEINRLKISDVNNKLSREILFRNLPTLIFTYP